MARVIVTKPAQKDLVDIRAYIRDELCNPSAAKRIISELKKSISALSSFSGRGRPLDALIPVHTDYRYSVVCSSRHTRQLLDWKAGSINPVPIIRSLSMPTAFFSFLEKMKERQILGNKKRWRFVCKVSAPAKMRAASTAPHR